MKSCICEAFLIASGFLPDRFRKYNYLLYVPVWVSLIFTRSVMFLFMCQSKGI